MYVDPATALRERGLRVTRQRVAVMSALARTPHAVADTVLSRVRDEVGQISTQAVYDVLNTLTDRGLVRRIQPAGSSARYELRVGDNHHHLVCRSCGSVRDIDCATGAAPCLDPDDLDAYAQGFVVDEAEVTFWGLCQTCSDDQGITDQEEA
jgi:Fur family transcriptional regulator, stress-responsive regulator